MTVVILTFISKINFILSSVEHEKKCIIFGHGVSLGYAPVILTNQRPVACNMNQSEACGLYILLAVTTISQLDWIKFPNR